MATKAAPKKQGPKNDNGQSTVRYRTAEQDAADRKAAQQRKKRAAGGGREVHNLPGLNQGLSGIARREHERRLELADKRQEQHDAALALLPGLVASDLARMVAEAVLAEFLTARPYNAASGKRVGATEVAVRQARTKHAALFRKDSAAAEAGVKAAKTALYRAANPDWEKADATRREARRSTPAKKPARRPYSDADIAELETAVGAASTNLRIAQAVNRPNVPVMMAKLAKAKKALASAKAANERFTAA